jgi:hypothetical protein
VTEARRPMGSKSNVILSQKDIVCKGIFLPFYFSLFYQKYLFYL